MSLNAARHAREIVDNIEMVVAIEFLTAAQALDLRLRRAEITGDHVRMGDGTAAAWNRIRQDIPYLDADRVLYPDIRSAVRLVRSRELMRLAQEAIR
jgi:histidine ammonia-lyase